MTTHTAATFGAGQPIPEPAEPRGESTLRLAIRAIVRVGIVIGLCVYGALSGWWQLWPVLGLMMLLLGVNLTVIQLRNPGLLRQRLKRDRPEKGWDKVVMIGGLVFLVAAVVIAWLDVCRFHWSIVPPLGMVAGALLVVVGDAITAWCMGTNPFLERTVRLQEERGHRVIDTGPYHYVRHPMYVGIILTYTGLVLVLGSYLALVPTFMIHALLVMRTHYEDRTLHEELPGYRDYAARTRYRLLPGVW